MLGRINFDASSINEIPLKSKNPSYFSTLIVVLN